ncbi:MAG: energy transducer TonB, partial [Flavobacteriia bacterium]
LMRSLFISMLFMIVSILGFAGKTYQMTIHVSSLLSGEALKGMVVRGVFEDGGELKGSTDENGNVVFQDLKAKEINFDITDPTNIHRAVQFFSYNSKKEDQVKYMSMRFTGVKEAELILSKKKSKDIDTSSITELMMKGLLENSDCDSAEYTSAEYPGGMREMMKFLINNLEYPQKAIEQGTMGKVYTRFIVEKNGSISNIEIVRGVSPEIDDEAIRILAYMPHWNPANCNNEPVRAMMMLPLNFYME